MGLWLAGVVLLCLALVALWRSTVAPPAAGVAESAASVEATATVVHGDAEDVVGEPPVDRAGEAARRTAVAPARPRDSLRYSRWTVRVIDARGDPAPDIPLRVVARGSRVVSNAAWRRVETDAAGEALVELATAPTASGPGLEARYSIDVLLALEPRVSFDLGTSPHDVAGPIELRLPPGALALVRPLEVLVLHADGSPAIGVPVRLQGAGPQGSLSITKRPEGLAQFWSEHGWTRAAIGSGLRVSCGLPQVEPVRGLLTDVHERVVLRLSPVGRVRARVVDRAGAQVDNALVRLEWRRPLDGGDTPWLRTSGYQRHAFGGEVEFIRIGVGLEVRLTAELPGERSLRATVIAEGPVRGGQTTAATLVLDAATPHLRGRLVDGDAGLAATGLPNQRFWLIFRRVGVRSAPATVADPRSLKVIGTTDPRGRFSVEVPSSLPGRSGLEVLVEARRGRGVDLRGRFALPVVLRSDIDVGDVVIEQPPVVVSGQVLYADGTPARDALVGLTSSDDGTPWRYYAVAGEDQGAGDAAGRFELRSNSASCHFIVQATARLGEEPKRWRLSSLSTLVPRGATDVRLVLEDRATEALGVIEGVVVLPAGARPALLEVEAHSGARRVAGRVTGQGYAVHVPAGVWTLRLRLRGVDAPVLEIADIVVPDHAASADPRVAELDLRDLVRGLPLVVGRESGGKWRHASLRLEAKGLAQRFVTDEAGAAHLLVPPDAGPFVVTDGERRTAPFSWAPTEQTVVLPAR